MANETVSKKAPPAHLARLNSQANAPWFDLKKGNVISGKLLNVYERNDPRSPSGKSKFFQIELSDSTDVRVGTGANVKKTSATAGMVVNLNYNTSTKTLDNLIPEILRGAEVEIYVAITGDKFAIKNGAQTMWPMDVRAGVVTPAPAADEPDFGGEGIAQA